MGKHVIDVGTESRQFSEFMMLKGKGVYVRRMNQITSSQNN